MNQHTPGPWHVIPYQYVLNEPMRARIHGANNAPVVDDANPSMADARLIAAAPELLEALRALSAWAESIDAWNVLVPQAIATQIDAALAKATP